MDELFSFLIASVAITEYKQTTKEKPPINNSRLPVYISFLIVLITYARIATIIHSKTPLPIHEHCFSLEYMEG